MQSFNFHTFGDEAVGSSRLRAWKIARELTRRGLSASVNSARPAEVEVFQKVRPLRRLAEAKSRKATVIYDFDDNYLLEEVGTRSDVLQFVNHCDLVSVGSHYLLKMTRPFHDRVLLMENPVDVAHDHSTKQDYEWHGRLGWFGNPNNLPALESLGLARRVTTVTRNGDVEWTLSTIDEVLRGFDLVLIPFELDGWQHAKNANRLLKCLALGVPFLASATPEHRRVADLVGLPEALLVGSRADWESRIAEMEESYPELPALLAPARERALEEFGVGAVTDRFLAELEPDSSRTVVTASIPDRSRAFADVDVVVLGETEPEFVARTVRSLRTDDVQYRSLTVISAHPIDLDPSGAEIELLDRHEDLFAIYATLSRVLAASKGRAVLFLRAGGTLCRGFFEHALPEDPSVTIRMFRTQRAVPDLGLEPACPARMDALLCEPYRPWALILPGVASWPADCRLESGFSCLAVWELLISLVSRAGFRLDEVAAPMVVVDAGLASRSPITSYSIFLNRLEPGLHKQLPGHDAEWQRLRATLHAAVIDEHQELFSRYCSTIIPRLSVPRPAKSPSAAPSHPLRSELWLHELTNPMQGEPPVLVRHADGKVHLLDSGMKRAVSSGLVAAALETLFGPCGAAAELDLDRYEIGPPAEIFMDTESKRLYFVAGGLRYQLTSLPIPLPARPAELRKVKRSDRTLDLARGSVPVSKHNQLLEQIRQLLKERLDRQEEEVPPVASLTTVRG